MKNHGTTMRHDTEVAEKISGAYRDCCGKHARTIALHGLRKKKKRKKKNHRRYVACLPVDDKVVAVVDDQVISRSGERSSKPGKRKLASFDIADDRDRAALRLPRGSRFLNALGRRLIFELSEEKGERRKVIYRFRIYPLINWQVSRAGTVFRVRMPGNAKIIGLNEGEVVVRLPKRPSKPCLWRLLTKPLEDRGRDTNGGETFRCYRVYVPWKSKILAVSRLGWIVAKVRRKYLKDDDLQKRSLISLEDDHDWPKARMVGAMNVRNIGPSLICLLPEED
jgi:hypothetical protein